MALTTNKKQPKNAEERIYIDGWKLFFGLSAWLTAPLAAAYFLGIWLDQKFHTKPWLFFGSLAIAFATTSFGIVYQILKLQRDIKNSEKAKKNENATKRNNQSG